MKRMSKTIASAVLIFAVLQVSCGKDDSRVDGDGELITSLTVTLTEAGSSGNQVFRFRDLDGPGGMEPSAFDSIVVNANRSYAVSVRFLNESVSPEVDITTEVVAEADDHQVYYESAGVLINAINYNLDGVGLPLGTTCTWNVGATGVGKMKITLKHKPGAKLANDPVTKGETDVEIEFPVRLK